MIYTVDEKMAKKHDKEANKWWKSLDRVQRWNFYIFMTRDWIATKYKDEPVKVSYYDKEGNKVSSQRKE